MGAAWTRAGPAIRSTLRRGAPSLIAVVLLAALAGGVVIAAVAGARRTETSYDRLREAEGAPDALVFAQEELNAESARQLRNLPGVEELAISTIVVLTAGANGIDRAYDFGIVIAADEASLKTLHPRHLKGRVPRVDAPREVLINENLARELDAEVGDELDLRAPSGDTIFDCYMHGACSNDLLDPIHVKVTGIALHAGDIDPDAFNGTLMWSGPGLAPLVPEGYYRAVTVANVRFEHGISDYDRFDKALLETFEGRFGSDPDDPAEANIRSALDVESRSLLLFALTAGIAGLVATAQAFTRHLGAFAADRRILAALGLTRTERALTAAVPGALAAAAATASSAAIAVAGSAFLPVGIAGRAEPDPGIDIDAAVLGAGAAIELVILLAAVAIASWRAASKDTRPPANRVDRPRRLPALPLTAAVGAEIAFPRSRRNLNAPILGAAGAIVLAIAVATAASVISASNDRMQHSPVFYGQPWDASASFDASAAAKVAPEVAANDDVRAVGLAAGGAIELVAPDGEAPGRAAVGLSTVKGSIEPTVLAGRAPSAPDEIALGSNVFDDYDVSIGDTIRTAAGRNLTIVGRVIVPIIGTDEPDDGAVLTLDGFKQHGTSDVPGEEPETAVVFRVAPGTDINELLDNGLGDAVSVLGAKARTPSDVQTLKGVGRFPEAVAMFTGVLAVVALLHALLVASIRRSGELATLRALGMLRRHVGAAVVWGGVWLLVVGLVIGLPLGAVAGRLVWRAIANSVHVVPDPATSVVALALIVAIGLVAALVAAVWPSRRALGFSPATTLRAD